MEGAPDRYHTDMCFKDGPIRQSDATIAPPPSPLRRPCAAPAPQYASHALQQAPLLLLAARCCPLLPGWAGLGWHYWARPGLARAGLASCWLGGPDMRATSR